MTRRSVWPSETQSQCAVIEQLRTRRDIGKMTFAIPNGGRRGKVEAARLVREGVLTGVSDLFVPAARAGWHGLFLEMKAHGKKRTPEQVTFHLMMEAEGYACVWTDNQDQAVDYVDAYLAGRMLRPNWVHFEGPAKG